MSTFPCNFCPEKISAELFHDGVAACPHCGMESRSNVLGRAPSRANLQFCPTCSTSVSLNANACPKCGHVFKNPGGINLKDPVHIIGIIVCGIIILIVIGIIRNRIIGI